LPKTDGQLSVRVISDREWVAFEDGLKAEREATIRDLTLTERGLIKLEWPCPEQGFLANENLAPRLDIKETVGNLQNLQLQLTVTDKNGRALGSVFSKDFGQKALDLPGRLSLEALPEGEYTLNLNI
jgi:hypothetical protein